VRARSDGGGPEGRRVEAFAAGGVTRRGAMAGGAALLAAGLGACAARPEPRARPAAAPPPEGPLARLLDGGGPVLVAGEPLDAEALRRFYARRGFTPVWAGRERLEERMVGLVLQAGEHGLDPEMFRAMLLRRKETFPALRREVLVTEALLSYAGVLAHGAVPPLRRKEFEALAPEPIDVVEAVGAALASADPAAAIEALAPATPTYRALRQAMREPLRGAAPRGRARAAEERRRMLEVNLERERWLPRSLPADRVWVNIPDQQLVLFQEGEPELMSRVVVGQATPQHQSPEFDALIEASFFNPPWVIPRDIVEAEILPRLEREPDFLERNNMVLRANGEVEQLPGPEAGLGRVLFDMPNRFDVYLHDTPHRYIFRRGDRRMSRGCIRVEKPRELAALLMKQPLEAIEEKIAAGTTTRSTLPEPVPVFVTYQTAFLDTEGRLQFRDDFYGRDEDLHRRLRARAHPQA
jgi:murein L,D-transpeptidase YcbB/YkuD